MSPAAASDGDERYAEQIIAADAVALGLLIGGHHGEVDEVRDAGVAVGLAGAPLVHLGHGNGRGAATSFALRVTLPLAAAYIADQLAPRRPCSTPAPSSPSSKLCDDDDPRLHANTVVGLVVGLAAASAIDAALLAQKPARRKGREWRPDIAFKGGGVRLSVRMTF